MSESITPQPELPFETAERWLPVVDWEDRYEVSDLGRVRSLRHPGGKLRATPLVRKLQADRDGRQFVMLQAPGRRPTTRAVHRLVLEAFVGLRPDGQVARHGPGGVSDNRVVNLCWGTQADNVGPDRVRDGTINRGERHWRARLTAEDVAAIRRQAAEGKTHLAIGREFGVTGGCVFNILSGITWAHTGDPHVEGRRRGSAVLTPEQVREIRSAYASGISLSALARYFGVCRATIAGIAHRQTWKNVA